jgi:hypothetical protein
VLARRPAVLAADLLVLGLTLWLLWPQHAGGYGLGHDLVFTPDQPLNADSVGLGSSSPRAVPLDALVALAGRLVGGMVTGRIALLVPLLAAGWGSTRLLRQFRPMASPPALLIVAGLAVWNPYLVERLALGQWALLWAYGALPWLVRAGLRIGRAPGPVPILAWAGLFSWLAVAAITPTGALIGAGALVAVASGRRLGRTGTVLAMAVLVQLPWLLPAVLSTASATSDPRAVAAFAARPERPGGALLSLLGLGGIWSSDVTPASRAGVLGYLSTGLVVLVLLVGVPLLHPVAVRWRLVGTAAAGLVLAAAGSLPGLAAVLRWTVRELPGAGLLRDGQKWLMPFVLLSVLAAGLALDRLVTAVGRAELRPLLALVGIAVPLLLLPDGPATLRTTLQPVHYPADWATVADQVRVSSGAVLALPLSSYRSFDWAPGRTVIDPAPRLLPAPVVVDDRLVVSGTVLAGEDPLAAEVNVLLTRIPNGAPGLGGLGIGWVLVEDDPTGQSLPNLTGLRPVFTGSTLRLYRVPGPITLTHRSATTRWLVIGADLLVGFAALIALACAMAGLGRRRLLHSPVTTKTEDHWWAS